MTALLEGNADSAFYYYYQQDKGDINIKLCLIAPFVYNNYWPLASVTQMISSLDWETLEAYWRLADKSPPDHVVQDH